MYRIGRYTYNERTSNSKQQRKVEKQTVAKLQAVSNEHERQRAMITEHRAESQLLEIVESLQRGMDKIEMLTNEKRKVKRVIKLWNFSYEKQNGRPPSQLERKQLAKSHYLEYQRLSRLLQVRTGKVESVLENLGLTRDEFYALRDSLDVKV